MGFRRWWSSHFFSFIGSLSGHEMLHDREPMRKLLLHKSFLPEGFWKQRSPALIPIQHFLEITSRRTKPPMECSMPVWEECGVKDTCKACHWHHVNPQAQSLNWCYVLATGIHWHLSDGFPKPREHFLHEGIPVGWVKHR